MDFTTINGYEFEDYVSNILRNMGFEIEQTTYSNDGGIDIVANYNKPIFSGRYIVQCKNWQGNVGAPEIRDLYGVVMDQRANKGILITPSDFTEQAYEFAKGKNIELINGVVLRTLSDSSSENTSQNYKLPDDFNDDRYNYLLNQIRDNRKIYQYYYEMEKFLLTYILSDKYDGECSRIAEIYVKHKEDEIKYCYNTKSKLHEKIIEEKNLVSFYLIAGKIDRAVDMYLNSEHQPFKYNNSMPAIKSKQMVVDYEMDCLIRNLHVAFKEMEYDNGLKFIGTCPERPYRYRDLINFYMTCRMKGIDQDKALQNYCSNFERYNDWDGFSVIYIPQFDSRKERGYYNDYVTIGDNSYIQIEKIKGKLKQIDCMDMSKKIDMVFRKHGYEF